MRFRGRSGYKFMQEKILEKKAQMAEITAKEIERENTLQRIITRMQRGRREGQGKRHKGECERRKKGGGRGWQTTEKKREKANDRSVIILYHILKKNKKISSGKIFGKMRFIKKEILSINIYMF